MDEQEIQQGDEETASRFSRNVISKDRSLDAEWFDNAIKYMRGDPSLTDCDMRGSELEHFIKFWDGESWNFKTCVKSVFVTFGTRRSARGGADWYHIDGGCPGHYDNEEGRDCPAIADIANPITQDGASASAQTQNVPDHSQASNPKSVSPESTSSISSTIAEIREDLADTSPSSSPMGVFRQHCIDLLLIIDSLQAEKESFLSAAKATLKYVDNLDERTPVDQNCKECMGKVFYPKGTPEPPLCFIHQTKAVIKKVENHERSS